MNYEELTPEGFSLFLLEKTKAAYEKSKIKRAGLFYSIAGTAIKKRKGVLMGLNWGGGGIIDNSKYLPQESLNNINKCKPEDYRFIRALSSYLEKYLKLKSVNDINYSNLCFFRSPQIIDLSPNDWKICNDLFKYYIDYIQPKWILLTSIAINTISILKNNTNIKFKEKKEFQQNNKIFIAYRGYYNQFPIYTIPYPYRAGGISEDTRKKIWDWHFANKNNLSNTQ